MKEEGKAENGMMGWRRKKMVGQRITGSDGESKLVRDRNGKIWLKMRPCSRDGGIERKRCVCVCVCEGVCVLGGGGCCAREDIRKRKANQRVLFQMYCYSGNGQSAC